MQSAELAAEEITYNRTGLPAISVPCGLDREGLPIGLQIAGRPFDEPTVLEVPTPTSRRTTGTTGTPRCSAC